MWREGRRGRGGGVRKSHISAEEYKIKFHGKMTSPFFLNFFVKKTNLRHATTMWHICQTFLCPRGRIFLFALRAKYSRENLVSVAFFPSYSFSFPREGKKVNNSRSNCKKDLKTPEKKKEKKIAHQPPISFMEIDGCGIFAPLDIFFFASGKSRYFLSHTLKHPDFPLRTGKQCQVPI